jgi:purine-nucleoside/S-methyl-5'-thioadenosine phosphorylase / adenosine deaminase
VLTLLDRRVAGRRFVVAASERSDGDVHPHHVAPDELADRQRSITGRRWSMVDQCHGTAVHRIDAEREIPTHAGSGEAELVVADVQRADAPGTHVAMWAADCAVVVLAGSSGNLVAVHAGWRGLADGAIDVACDELGDTAIAAVLGPTIHPCCYEFGGDDLARVAEAVGAEPSAIAGTTTSGRRALDVPLAVRTALARRGVELDAVGPCTGCDDRWFSHRVRRDRGRHATIGWMDAEHDHDEPARAHGV